MTDEIAARQVRSRARIRIRDRPTALTVTRGGRSIFLASFQRDRDPGTAAPHTITAEETGARSILILSGGVASQRRTASAAARELAGYPVYFPAPGLCHRQRRDDRRRRLAEILSAAEFAAFDLKATASLAIA